MTTTQDTDNALLWERILEAVQAEVNNQCYRTWFLPTRLARVEDGTLYIEGPNQFFMDWLSEHHLATLQAASAKILGRPAELEFITRGVNGGDGQSERKDRKSHVSFFRRYSPPPSKSGGLKLNPTYSFEEFVVGQNNRMAHAASLAVAEKLGRVYNPLFIYGGVGLGKTHLAQAVAHFVLAEHKKAKVFYASTESFMNELIFSIRQGKTLEFKNKYRNVDLLIIDDIHFLAGKESTQEEFFHTFNALHDSSKQIVVTSDRAPKDIRELEERLVSRFEWGLIADIQPPDLETRMAILRKKIEKDNISIGDDVLFLIAESVRSNIRELEGSLIRLLAFSGLTNSKIDIDLAREVLKDFVKAAPREPNLQDIQRVVAQRFDVSVDLLKSSKRSSFVVLPRQVAIYLARDLTEKSLSEIGREFGGRDHSTVLHACRKIAKQIKDDHDLRNTLTELQQQFRVQSPSNPQ
ncbi:MAG: chromosomal replication initiator protein DnaA [Candidatus Krumholzibacteriia bacterium]|nr:chromosomal replication initiator protein DnaA [Candidatus Latescibacterota bacterium]MCB9517065.1 chromosomal replication initiator protein DnaA [Candidatus Latescibacterota bacterium]